MAFATQNATPILGLGQRFAPDKVGVVLKGYEDGLAAFERMTSLMLSVSHVGCVLARTVQMETSLERR